MRRYLLLILMLLLACAGAEAQTLKLVRTDVDSTRNSFVTATYTFGFDIMAEGALQCNGAAFELHFNQTDYVKFSEWSYTDSFGENPVAVVIPTYDPLTDSGVLSIGISSGETLDGELFDNPRLIHLEFVVLQSAPHGQEITFSFINPQVVVKEDTAGVVLDLEVDPIPYMMHSFIDVWPGDTNADGIVNSEDFSLIFQHNGTGSATKSFRSFKRKNASTLWTAQQVLAWDSASVTHVDCDGDADITLKDMLVFSANLGKEHEITMMPPDTEEHFPAKGDKKASPNSDAIRLPVYITLDEDIRALMGKVDIRPYLNDFEVIGLEPGDLYSRDNSYFVVNEFDEYLEFATGVMHYAENAQKNGVACNLLLKAKNTNKAISPRTLELKGINDYSTIVNLQQVLSVEQNNEDNLFSRNDNEIIFKDYLNWIKVYNLEGQLIDLKKDIKRLNLESYTKGAYAVEFQINNKIYREILIF